MHDKSNIALFFTKLRESGFSETETLSDNDIANYNLCTFPTDSAVLAVIKPIPDSAKYPQRYQKIIVIIELAKTFNIPIYPISCGKNWGYGSTIPMGDSAVILDLSLFNLITRYSKELAQVSVEPGVTQQQLYQFLKENGDDFWMDATGAPTNSSIVGNTVECGFGHSRKAQRSQNVLNMSVLIPWGTDTKAEVISTSLDGTVNPLTEDIRAIDIGPNHSKSFLQSNSAIVLNMTMILSQKEPAFCAYFIDLNDSQFEKYIEIARKLRRSGIIHSASHIGNKHKAIQMALGQYPYEAVNNVTPLPDSYIDKVCEQYGISDWTASGAFYGTAGFVEACKKDLTDEVTRLGATITIVDDKKLSSWESTSKFLNRNGLGTFCKTILSKASTNTNVLVKKLELLPHLKALYDLKKGVPTDHFVKTIFWRSRIDKKLIENGLDPNDVNAGFIWIAPTCSIEATKIQKLTTTIAQICAEYEFEPALSITLLNERAAECVLSISFDNENTNERNNAMMCHEKILLKTAEMGNYVYRLSSASAKTDISTNLRQDFKRLDLKTYYDPGNIIAPGKYRSI